MRSTVVSLCFQCADLTYGEIRIGPISRFEVRRDAIRDCVTDSPLAFYTDGFWRVGGLNCTRLDCDAAVRIVPVEGEAMQPMRDSGHFSIFDGTAYVDRQVFAHFDASSLRWHLQAQDVVCEAFGVESAGT